MYESSTEQIIKIKTPKKAYVFIGLLIIACIAAITTIPATGYFGVFLLIIFVIFTVLLFRYYNSEYEYILVDGELNVDRIMAKTSRKRCGTYSIEKASMIAVLTSNEAMGMEKRQLRTSDFTADSQFDKQVVIYTYNAANEMERIYIQPDEKMLNAIKECAPRDSFKINTDFEK